MKKFLALLFFSLLFRLWLAPLVFHQDLVIQGSWGHWIWENSFYGFYENSRWPFEWPTQPLPISALYGGAFYLHEGLNTLFTSVGYFIAIHRLAPTLFLWFYRFVIWFGSAMYGLSDLKYGELICIKVFPILADLALAGMIYGLAQKKADKKIALGFSALYLFSPFSWYVSALWGQVDQLGTLLLILSFLLLGKLPFLSPLLLALSIGIKPTALVFVPFLFWLALKNKKRALGVLGGSLLALLLYYFWVSRITYKSFLDFNLYYKMRMLTKGEYWTWVNTFNFWRIVTGYLTRYSQTFLFLSYKIWGYLLFGFFYLLALLVARQKDLKSLLIALFLIAGSSWFFLVTMHERYFFAAVFLGLLLSAYERRLLKYWLVLSLIFMINLYNGWWYPSSLDFLKSILVWHGGQDGLVPKALSAINLIIFLRMTAILVPLKGFRLAAGK